LRYYFALFPRDRVRVSFYDDLRDNPRCFMQELSTFLGIDAHFWSSASFERMNVSFAGRRPWLHKLAIFANDRLEPLLRPRKRLKKTLLGFYKAVNRAADRDRSLAIADRGLLEEFYAPANNDLEALLGTALPRGWARARSPSPSGPESSVRHDSGAALAR
jgi:hypothetical protein